MKVSSLTGGEAEDEFEGDDVARYEYACEVDSSRLRDLMGMGFRKAKVMIDFQQTVERLRYSSLMLATSICSETRPAKPKPIRRHRSQRGGRRAANVLKFCLRS